MTGLAADLREVGAAGGRVAGAVAGEAARGRFRAERGGGAGAGVGGRLPGGEDLRVTGAAGGGADEVAAGGGGGGEGEREGEGEAEGEAEGEGDGGGTGDGIGTGDGTGTGSWRSVTATSAITRGAREAGTSARSTSREASPDVARARTRAVPSGVQVTCTAPEDGRPAAWSSSAIAAASDAPSKGQPSTVALGWACAGPEVRRTSAPVWSAFTRRDPRRPAHARGAFAPRPAPRAGSRSRACARRRRRRARDRPADPARCGRA